MSICELKNHNIKINETKTTENTKWNLLQYDTNSPKSKPPIKWNKISKDREDLNNVINKVDLIKHY